MNPSSSGLASSSHVGPADTENVVVVVAAVVVVVAAVVVAVVVVVVVVVVVRTTACNNLCVFDVFPMCIKTKNAPRLHEVPVC